MKNGGNIAIVGAGMAGITAARRLRDAGHAVSLFDKGSQPGGRLATRRGQYFTFNHGCQFFTPRDPGFRAATHPHAAAWDAAGPDRYAGLPDMAGMAAALATGLTIRQHANVIAIARENQLWRLAVVEPDGESSLTFNTLLLALPAPQAAALLAPTGHRFAAALRAVHLAPCWAVMLGFSTAVDGPAVEKPSDGPIGWMARENARPGAAASPIAYTIHANAEWSAAHLEDSPETVIATLTAAAGLPTPRHAAAHRWRYALADAPLGEDCLWDPAHNLGLCGDWCLGGRLEAAFLSGAALGIRAAA